MYLRAKKRIKDGKEHRYWSIVESCRNLDGRVVQRQVLYLGEINDSQKAAWCRTIEVLQTDSSAKQVALLPTDRQAPELDCEVVQVNLNELAHLPSPSHLHTAACLRLSPYPAQGLSVKSP